MKRRYQVLAEMINERRYQVGVELGTHRGETFYHLLRRCPQLTLTTIDAFRVTPENPVVKHRWSHAYNERLSRHRAKGFPDRATVLKSDTVEAAADFENGSLDFVFVDADHSVMGCYRDIVAWYPKLKTSGAMLGHDFNWPSVDYVIRNLFGSVSRYDDHVWEGRKPNWSWSPDQEEAAAIDSETKLQYHRSVPKNRGPLRKRLRLMSKKYGI